ncbi:hypothetical protein K7432_000942 [Basidiobolus ranarum]|uniref:Uncharacterized protein n=1 Tax=Basidiobolus ranarum TaxID=34480 RepID=A0ABR2WAF9_9FUNG
MQANLDQDFEKGLRHVKDAYYKKIDTMETEIRYLSQECGRKDVALQELRLRFSQMETELQRSF